MSTSQEVEVEKLLKLELHDPHALLGAHAGKRGVTVRVFRVDAAEVILLPEDGEAVPMKKVHDAGLFESSFPDHKSVFAYRIEVRRPVLFPPVATEVIDAQVIREDEHDVRSRSFNRCDSAHGKKNRRENTKERTGAHA